MKSAKMSSGMVLALLILSACASRYQRCVAVETADLRIVRALIAEAEENLERGFALAEPRLVTTGYQLCLDRSGLSCAKVKTQLKKQPVAIDPEAERRKLEGLRAREARLEADAAARVQQCRADYLTG